MIEHVVSSVVCWSHRPCPHLMACCVRSPMPSLAILHIFHPIIMLILNPYTTSNSYLIELLLYYPSWCLEHERCSHDNAVGNWIGSPGNVTDVTVFFQTLFLQLVTLAGCFPLHMQQCFYIDQCSRTICTSHKNPEANICVEAQVRDKFSKNFKHLPNDSMEKSDYLEVWITDVNKDHSVVIYNIDIRPS
jgi:hypothetical protein